jgi:predicted outer membrane repeat protein
MRNEGGRGKFFICFLIAVWYLISACTNIFEPPVYREKEPGRTEIGAGKGIVHIITGTGEARTALPAAVFDHYEYWFTRSGERAVKVEPQGGVFELEAGSWTVMVKAFAEAGDTSLAAEGSSGAFTITEGADAGTIPVTLYPVVSEGNGNLSYTLTYPVGVTVDSFSLTLLAGDAPVDLAGGAATNGTDPVTLSGSKTGLAAGYYLARVALRKPINGTEASMEEVVHIYKNMNTDLVWSLGEAYFTAVPVVSSADSGPGTLREAITNAAAGNTIFIDLPEGDRVITLTSPLVITKNLTIAGNGVTLTRASSWASSSDSQLLRTGSGPIKISRVHFKNGLATDYGGALYNSGTLALESCIFSENQTTRTDALGGAVYSAAYSYLTIRGCTFYGNSTTGGGGAVFLYATRLPTLTGNLFYGNTAGDGYYVVEAALTAGETINASYNIVDLAFKQCGWEAGLGDAYSADRFVLDKSFTPLYGSSAAGRLPDPLPVDYPAADFYGQPIHGGGTAGAVQRLTPMGYSYLDLSINNSQGGSLSISPEPDEDGLVPNGSVTLTASPVEGCSFEHWIYDGFTVTANPYTLTVNAYTRIQAVFSRVVTVNIFTDAAGSATTPGTLRYALANAQDGDVVQINGPGVIELESPLPYITKSITIAGNGVTLTPAASWTTGGYNSPLLGITVNSGAVVSIRRVHFKDARELSGAIRCNYGTLTLESCIFSGNRAVGYRQGGVTYGGGGGAVYSYDADLTIRGCTFYGNAASFYGGAVYFRASGKTLTLTGNLFYGNIAGEHNPVIDGYGDGRTVSASYNVVDVPFGWATAGSIECGWVAGTGDVYSTGMIVSPRTFKAIYGSPATDRLPAALPADYPTMDFYGQPVSGGGAAGAVQTVTPSGYSCLDLTVNYNFFGSLSASPEPDEDGLVLIGSTVTLTASPAGGYSFQYWVQDGVTATAPNPYTLTISGHTRIQAVFGRVVTVNDFSDGAGSTSQVTLRYALNNAQDGEVIRFSGAGIIELASALPEITNSLSIEGTGVTLTRAASWTSSTNTSQLLRITNSNAAVSIRGIHFKDGLAVDYGGAVRNNGTLTLESCIFSGNQTTANYGNGGAIWSNNALIIRGCTFYGNTAATGGAVYFNSSATLILMGNLFYENTASNKYVVYISGYYSASYNVVDVPFLGWGSIECGWSAGTGDTYSAVPFISPRTFKALYGSGAAGRLPASLPDNYPATDFYGQPVSGGGAAGAVQAVTPSGYSYLDLTVNDSQRGSLSVSPVPNEDGLVPSGSVTLTASPAGGYFFQYWVQDGVTAAALNPRTLTVNTHTRIQVVFGRAITVNDFSDGAGSTSQVTLRYALNNAQDGDIIRFSGSGVIELAGDLPTIIKNLTIEGTGVTLTHAVSWTSSSFPLLHITNSDAVVSIRGIHFKDGRTAGNGGAIYNFGTLTLESCIFSGNSTTGSYVGGTVYSSNTMTIRGCTFYRNTARDGGAVYFNASGKTLTLTGNLFYGNTAYYPVVYRSSGTVSASYNVVDAAFGTGSGQCGWTQGAGDSYSTALPVSSKTFKILYGSPAAAKLPDPLPEDYPAIDFYGQPVSGGGAAGAIQAVTPSGYSYLEVTVNDSQRGSVAISPEPDEDGLIPNGSVILTASPVESYSLQYWAQDGVTVTAPNPYALTVNTHTRIQAVFGQVITVNDFSDGVGSTSQVTLRYALNNAQDYDVIRFNGAGVIELASALPYITKNVTIAGNGVILTRAVSWTGSTSSSQLFRITNTNTAVSIRGIHFKDGLATNSGGAIYSNGTLTLESCIFSGNRNGGNGGAVYCENTLTIRGCTFYGNAVAYGGGAVYFGASGKTLTLTGNLFYGNTASSHPVVYRYSGTVSASYNVVDAAFGTGNTQCGWTQGTGDKLVTALLISGKTFRLLSGSGAAGVITTLPAGYPTADFYGASIGEGAAAGAVQATVAGSGYYLDLSVNNSLLGTVTVSPERDEDSLIAGSFTLTATPNSGYVFGHWLVNGVQTASAPATISGHTWVQAVFNRTVIVNAFTDAAGSATTPGTLRYALTNAQDGDVISFSGVTAGTTVVELQSALPTITTSIRIEGNGVTLTRSSSWTIVNTSSQLLSISNFTAEIRINGIHFKNGRTTSNGPGAAIYNIGTLTMESCVFSGNQTPESYGGAICSTNTLTIRGCTFYRNTARDGGAVYFIASGKTLTLTGNLFYGNTASSHPVVYSGGTASASYNVVDAVLGTGSSGWAQGTGDTTFTALGITGDPLNTATFAPVTALQTVLPSSLADFPATDFYGATRTFPGSPGAVK